MKEPKCYLSFFVSLQDTEKDILFRISLQLEETDNVLANIEQDILFMFAKTSNPETLFWRVYYFTRLFYVYFSSWFQ